MFPASQPLRFYKKYCQTTDFPMDFIVSLPSLGDFCLPCFSHFLFTIYYLP